MLNLLAMLTWFTVAALLAVALLRLLAWWLTLEAPMPAPARPAYVAVDGPFPSQDPRTGDEVPEYSVTLFTAQDRPLRSYHPRGYARACALALDIARDRRLQLVIDASPA